jgi:hypothetical protein
VVVWWGCVLVLALKISQLWVGTPFMPVVWNCPTVFHAAIPPPPPPHSTPALHFCVSLSCDLLLTSKLAFTRTDAPHALCRVEALAARARCGANMSTVVRTLHIIFPWPLVRAERACVTDNNIHTSHRAVRVLVGADNGQATRTATLASLWCPRHCSVTSLNDNRIVLF